MLVKTIVIKNSSQELVNGALLCGFSIPELNRNFIVYSLNEEGDAGRCCVYIATLHKDGERCFLAPIVSEREWELASGTFNKIVFQVSQGEKPAGGVFDSTPYHLIDLRGCTPPQSNSMDHRSLDVKKEWLAKLIMSNGDLTYLPAIDNSGLVVPSIRVSFFDTPQREVCTASPEGVESLVFDHSFSKPGSAEEGPEILEPSALIVQSQSLSDNQQGSSAPGASGLECAEAGSNVDERESFPELASVADPENSLEPQVPQDAAEATVFREGATTAIQAEKNADTDAFYRDAVEPDVESESLQMGLKNVLADLAEVAQELTTEGVGSESLPLLHDSPSPLMDEDAQPLCPDVGTSVALLPETNGRCPETVETDVSVSNVFNIPFQESADDVSPVSEDAVSGSDTEHLLFDVENTLSNVARMAQELTQQKLLVMKQHETLEALKGQLQERERHLLEKDEHLRQFHVQLHQEKAGLEKTAEHNSRTISERTVALQQLAESIEARERSISRRAEVLQLEQQRLEDISVKQTVRASELEKREAGVQRKNLDLAEKLKQLNATKKKLSGIVKAFNETVTFNNSLHTLSSTVLNDVE